MSDTEQLPRRRVVVINDEPAVLDLYRELLSELDFQPVTLATTAVETERIKAAEPDAVILDLEVGDQATYGTQMARQLREDSRYTAIPIIVATARAEALDSERPTLREIGVPILLKPFTIDELERHLEGPHEDE